MEIIDLSLSFLIETVFSVRTMSSCNQTNCRGRSPLDTQLSSQGCPSEVTPFGTGCNVGVRRSPTCSVKKVTDQIEH